MNLTLNIPDDLVGQLTAAGGDLSLRAPEEYKSGRIGKAALRRLLGIASRMSSMDF
jgi:hypothetical protein